MPISSKSRWTSRLCQVPVHDRRYPPASEGGILHYNTRELHVECLPGALPNHIEVDASGLAIGQGIHLKEMAQIEGVRHWMIRIRWWSVAVPISDAKLEALLTSCRRPWGPKAGGCDQGQQRPKAKSPPLPVPQPRRATGAEAKVEKQMPPPPLPESRKERSREEEVTLRLIVGLGNLAWLMPRPSQRRVGCGTGCGTMGGLLVGAARLSERPFATAPTDRTGGTPRFRERMGALLKVFRSTSSLRTIILVHDDRI